MRALCAGGADVWSAASRENAQNINTFAISSTADSLCAHCVQRFWRWTNDTVYLCERRALAAVCLGGQCSTHTAVRTRFFAQCTHFLYCASTVRAGFCLDKAFHGRSLKAPPETLKRDAAICI